LSLERVLKALVGLGLSQTDAEIYVHLATAGPATAKSITSDLTINKRQIYRSLKALQQKGIVSGNDEYPAEFSVVSFEKALDLLLEVKKEQAKSLEASKAELISDFQTEKKRFKDRN
jgi:HTH-type transcriptional regulator, sugar sensing transcriptional regulator